MKKTNLLFYSAALLSLVIGIVGFLALADIIQWVIHFPNEFTYTVFNYRFLLMGVGIALFLVTVYLGFRNRLVRRWKLIAYTGMFLILFTGGFIAPTYLMFRSQHYSAQFTTVEEAMKHLSNDEEVLVVEVDGDARAYPHIWITQPHVAGDIIGGQDIVMTYCGLSHLGQAYKNDLDGEKMNLKVMTQLENNLILFDGNTQEPIQQIYSCCENSGRSLEKYPSTVMSLGSFQKLYPMGKVFFNPCTNPIDKLTQKMMFGAIYGEGGQFDFNNPDPSFPTIEYNDERISSKERVFGVSLNDESIAYTLQHLKANNNVVVEEIGGKIITVKYFPEYDFVDIFWGDAADVNPWGYNNKGCKIERIPHHNQILWIIWSNFYQNTEIRV